MLAGGPKQTSQGQRFVDASRGGGEPVGMDADRMGITSAGVPRNRCRTYYRWRCGVDNNNTISSLGPGI